jgi:hypothetical protein
MAFTASALLRLNVALSSMFGQDVTTTKAPIDFPAVSARAVLNNQNARVDERLEGNKCVGIKAWYIDYTVGSDVAAATNCTTPGGNVLATLSKNYDSTVLAQHAETMDAPRCDNELTKAEEYMAAIKICMAKIRKDLNVITINKLNSNAGANVFTPLPNLGTAWDGTTNTPRINVPSADFKWDNIGWFKQVAEGNSLGDHIFLSGATNFYGEAWKSQYMKFDANGPSTYQAYQDHRFYFDSRALDQTLTGANTFVFNPANFIFWNNVHSPAVPTEFSVGTNGKKFIFTMEDPELNYVRNGKLVPVVYHVELEESCSSRTTLGELVKSYKLYMYLVGGLEAAPAAPGGQTGALKFRAV